MSKFKDWLFRVFGETNSILWFVGMVWAIQLALVIGIIWVAVHFICKYW